MNTEISFNVPATRAHLARLQEHFAVLKIQRQRADGRCQRIAENPNDVNEADLLRAELFATRIETLIQRALKELRKTENELQKALAKESEGETPVVSSTESKSPEITSAPSVSKQAQSPSNTTQPAQFLHTAEELTNIKARFRNRIQNTPPADRPAFIARLIEEQREKNCPKDQEPDSRLPRPSQNGKHAA